MAPPQRGAAASGTRSGGAARRQAAHKALLPTADDSDSSYEADDASEESSEEESSEEEATRRRRSGRRTSSLTASRATALQALTAERARRATRRRVLSSDDDDDDDGEQPARAARRAPRRAASPPKASSSEEAPAAEEEEGEDEEDEDERAWRRRHAREPAKINYEYRPHVTGLRLERLSADEASDSGLSDFIAGDEEEEEEEEADEAPRKGVVRRLRPAAAAPPAAAPAAARAAPAASPPAADAAAALEDDDDDGGGAVRAKPAARRRSRVIADEEDEEEEDDLPVAAALRGTAAAAPESAAPPRKLRRLHAKSAPVAEDSEDVAEPQADVGGTPGTRKRLRTSAERAEELSPTAAARNPPRRELNQQRARAQDALARLMDLRGKERSARDLDAKLLASAGGGGAAGGDSSASESDSDEAAAAFCVSDDAGDGDEDAGAGDEDDGAVACVCGAATEHADEVMLLVQCANTMCRVWQHAACVGLAGTAEELAAVTFFCARCRPAADALLADADGGAALPAAGFAPVAGVGAELAPSEAATRAWRSVHGARDVGAAVAGALAADRAPQLRALLAHSRPGALKISVMHNGGPPLRSRAAVAGAVQCLRLLLRMTSFPLPKECMGTEVAAFCAALEAAQPAAARACLQEMPGLLAFATKPGAYEGGGTALHAAAVGGDVECLRLALPEGAAAHAAATAADAEGATPLMLAAASAGGAAAVNFILQVLGAGIPAKKEMSRVDSQGQTACHFAASAGSADAVNALVSVLPSLVHGHDSHGSTPLHLGAAEGRGAAIRVLLQHGASVVSRDHASWVPLMYASVADVEGTKALLEHQPEAQLAAMASLMSDARAEARVLKILRALAETPAFFSTLNAFLRSRTHLLSGNLAFLLRRPAVLDVGNKLKWFRAQVAAYLRAQPVSLLDELDSDAELDGGGGNVLWVSRASAFDDWAAWAARHSEGAWRRPMWRHLRLVDAPASMGSGVERETLELMAACLAAGGLLAPTAEGGRALAAPPGPLTPARRQSLVALGWLLGYCLLHERTLPLPLEGPFLRALLGRRATGLAELEAVDPVFHRSLALMLASPGAADLGLTFSVEEGGKQVELVPGGEAIAVTDANKAEFAEAVAAWKLSLRSAQASAAVREGLTDVVPPELLRIFHEGDLALLLGGAAEVDIADWRAHTLYDGFDRAEPLVSWFWQCVEAMSREERALLLKLATGASRVPPAGFAALQGLAGPQKFTIMRVASELDRLPTASTCFNCLKCPRYASFQQLERKLLAAVRFGAGGFDFV